MKFPDFSLIFSKKVRFPWLSLIWKRAVEIPWFSLIFPDAGHPDSITASKYSASLLYFVLLKHLNIYIIHF